MSEHVFRTCVTIGTVLCLIAFAAFVWSIAALYGTGTCQWPLWVSFATLIAVGAPLNWMIRSREPPEPSDRWQRRRNYRPRHMRPRRTRSLPAP